MRYEIQTKDAPAAVGPFIQGTWGNGNAFTSGQLPIDPKTGTMPEDIKAQARIALQNIEAILNAGNSNLANAAKVTIFLVDMADLPAVIEVFSEFFSKVKPFPTPSIFPALSVVQVAGLRKPGAKLEIEAIGLLK